jgi:hypothetical protein
MNHTDVVLMCVMQVPSRSVIFLEDPLQVSIHGFLISASAALTFLLRSRLL